MVDVTEEIIFTGSNPTVDRRTRRLAASGKLRKIHSSIYTSNLTEPVESIGLRHALDIAGHLFPGAVLSGRTAKEMRPRRALGQEGSRTGPGFVFLCHVKARRSVALPGVQISAIHGAGPQPGDFPLLTLYGASTARALLDNLASSRSVKGPSRTLSRAEVEQWLDKLCDKEGELHLNRIRDAARALAAALGLESELSQLDRIIAALLRTREARLTSPAAKARNKGQPYDDAFVKRCTILAAALRSIGSPETAREPPSAESRISASFIEAYFSNCIEGTRFVIEEARSIVFDGVVPAQRSQDGHDVPATNSNFFICKNVFGLVQSSPIEACPHTAIPTQNDPMASEHGACKLVLLGRVLVLGHVFAWISDHFSAPSEELLKICPDSIAVRRERAAEPTR